MIILKKTLQFFWEAFTLICTIAYGISVYVLNAVAKTCRQLASVGRSFEVRVVRARRSAMQLSCFVSDGILKVNLCGLQWIL
jgi:hypothetical protein